MITVNNLQFKPFIAAETIQQRIDELGVALAASKKDVPYIEPRGSTGLSALVSIMLSSDKIMVFDRPSVMVRNFAVSVPL
jgi:hypothetical protein